MGVAVSKISMLTHCQALTQACNYCEGKASLRSWGPSNRELPIYSIYRRQFIWTDHTGYNVNTKATRDDALQGLCPEMCGTDMFSYSLRAAINSIMDPFSSPGALLQDGCCHRVLSSLFIYPSTYPSPSLGSYGSSSWTNVRLASSRLCEDQLSFTVAAKQQGHI